NGASMFLPIISACWLFRYRGMFVSLVLNGVAFQLTYLFLLRGMLPDQAFVEGGLIGFGTSLGLGLVVCWLRTAVDLVHVARQHALVAEQDRLQALQAERHITLAYEYQRQVNDLKDQFLLHVNHELRTPLTALGSFLELFKEYFEQLDPVERTQLLTRALASYEELVSLVNGVLDAIKVTEAVPSACCEGVLVRLKRDLAGPARGTGLGLYICKHLVEAMRGRIWVESSGRMGEGSRFCVILPPFPPSPLPLPD